jgi:hypothetical protein
MPSVDPVTGTSNPRTLSSVFERMDMERFVWLIVAGGIALVGGLWLVAVFELWLIAWAVGAALALLGTGSLLTDIGSEIDP